MKKSLALLLCISVFICGCGKTSELENDDDMKKQDVSQSVETTINPTEEPIVSDTEIISKYYDVLYMVRMDIDSGAYVSVTDEVNKLQEPLELFIERANEDPQEYADYFKNINSSQYFQHLYQEYFNKSINYDEDKNEAKSHALILKTYIELLLNTQLPFEYEKNIEMIKILNQKEEESKLCKQYKELITAYHRLGWNEKFDDNNGWDLYIPQKNMLGVDSTQVNPKIGLKQTEDQRTMSFYLTNYEKGYGGQSINSVTFRSGNKKVVFKKNHLWNYSLDDFLYIDTIVYDTNEDKKYNQQYQELKELFSEGNKVEVIMGNKRMKVYSKKEIKEIQKYFFLYDILLDKYF